MRKRIACYRTKSRAQRYAQDLAARWPMYQFRVTNHPLEFGYTVIVGKPGFTLGNGTYVLSRPRGGIAQLGYTGN